MTGMLCIGDKSFSDHARYACIYAERKETYLRFFGSRIRDTEKDDPYITVVDYGTCDGGNILPMFEAFAYFLKEQKTEKKLKCVLSDADHSIMKKLTQKTNESRLTKDKHVTIVTTICDCYQPCFPEKSVDIAFCMFVLHWLSSPCPIERGLFWLDTDEEEHNRINLKAEEDWFCFLKNRAKELKTGAYLVTVIPGHDPDSGTLPTYPAKVFRDMLKRNEISQEEFERTTIDIFPARTMSDFKKPFQNGLLNELSLLEVTSRAYYLKDLGVTSDTVTDYVKSWMYNGIMNGLSQERSLEEKKSVCDLYFDYLQNSFQNNSCSFQSFRLNLYECVIQKG